MSNTENTVIESMTLNIKWADDEIALSDLVMDLETIIEQQDVISLGDSTPALLRELIAALNTAWTAAAK